jgi:hypothetical protein
MHGRTLEIKKDEACSEVWEPVRIFKRIFRQRTL